MLDKNGRLPQDLLAAGYDKYSAYDLAWQSLHMAAAAACRGSTATGGSGPWHNAVMVHAPEKKSCAQICAATAFSNCDVELSILGTNGKATKNGQVVGAFYNYGCNHAAPGESEVSSSDENVMDYRSRYFSFCCCRK